MANEPTIEFTGNVGKDPETHTYSNGNTTTTINVAVTPSYQKNGQWVEKETMWFQITPITNSAKAQIPYITKGARVVVNGQLSTFTKEDNTKYLQVAARTIGILHTGQQQAPAPQTTYTPPQAGYAPQIDAWGQPAQGFDAQTSEPPF